MATADKLSYLLDTKTKIKDAVNDDISLIDDSTTFREYPNKINSLSDTLKKYIPTETKTGYSIQINNAVPLNAKSLIINGNSYQKVKILPEEYTQIDYIESYGNEYIDTGRYPSDIEDVVCKIKVNQNSAIYGCWNQNAENGSNNRRHLYATSNGINIGYGITGNALVECDYSQILNINAHFENKNQILNVNNKQNSSLSNYPNNPQLNCYLFCRNVDNTTNAKISMKLYTFKIFEEGNLVRNFVPCFRNADNSVGLYDLVNDTFYENQGSGAFTYGSIVDIPNPDYPQEIEIIKNISLSNNEDNYSIDLQGNFIGKINDVKDTLDLATGILTKKIGKVSFENYDAFSVNSVTEKAIQFLTPSLNGINLSANNIKSNYFSTINGVTLSQKIRFKCPHKLLNISDNSNNEEIKNAFIELMNGKTLEFYYELETPQEIQLEPLKIKMYEGTNNIELISNLEAEMTLEYYKDYTLDSGVIA